MEDRTRLAFALILFMVIITIVEGSATENYLKVVSADEVLAAIQENDPIEYDNCIIEGKLNLSELFVNRSEDS